MKSSLLILFLLVSVIGWSQAPVIPDSTFNGTGRNVFSVGGTLDYGQKIALQTDGSIVMTGATLIGDHYQLGVTRLWANGTTDTTFGTQGVTLIDLGSLTSQSNLYPSLQIQGDGSIVISGIVQNASPANTNIMVCKLLPDGTLDPSFGTGGKVIVDMTGNNKEDIAYAMTTDPSGNIYVCGSSRTGVTPMSSDVSVLKLLPSGTLDPSFSGDGKQLLDVSAGAWDYGRGIHVNTDGTIVIGGYAGLPSDFFAVRLSASGSYDPTFSGDGKILIDVMGVNAADEVWGMNVDPDGKILLAGNGFTSASGSNIAGAVVRLTTAGNLDFTFNTNGITTSMLSATYNSLKNVIRLPDGRYLVTGDTKISADKDFAIMRINADGSLDMTFNNQGYYTLDVTGSGVDDLGYGAALINDEHVLIAGSTSVNPGSDEDYSISKLFIQNVVASFSYSSTQVCMGGEVIFTNASIGNELFYEWIFEGGSPDTTDEMSPLVTYSAVGSYDVRLVAYNMNHSDTLFFPDMINVIETPTAPLDPSGPTATCNLQIYEYTVAPVASAISYAWTLDPADAGTLTFEGTTATFTAAETWTGDYTLQVSATNDCGTSALSPPLTCTLNHTPLAYPLDGQGAYCEGFPGANIILTGSETNVAYELCLDGVPTGSFQAGTGTEIQWLNIATPGTYTVMAYTASCMQVMIGQIDVEVWTVPVQPAIPTGSVNACNDTPEEYYVAGTSLNDQMIWALYPEEAGTLTTADTAVTIEWNADFTGTAYLSVHGENMCGIGTESDALNIEVHPIPVPEVSGLNTACIGWSTTYECGQNTGSSYNWTVSGGTITSGAGTSQVTITWETLGAGYVTVAETNINGCAGNALNFEVNVDACVGLDELSKKDGIRIFPNPVNDNFSIVLDQPAGNNTKIMLSDPSGRTLWEWRVASGTTLLQGMDVRELSAGVYVLKVFTDNELRSQMKIVKN